MRTRAAAFPRLEETRAPYNRGRAQAWRRLLIDGNARIGVAIKYLAQPA
jgi:hypothetical protein